MCAHLFAKQSLSAYGQSLNDVEILLNKPHKNSEIMIGVDLQDKIGPYDDDYSPALVGPFAEGPRGAKGRAAVNLFVERFGLVAMNTIHPQSDGTMTHWDTHVQETTQHCFVPRQIDFMFMSERLASRSSCRADDSCTTESDHRPVVATIMGNEELKARAKANNMKFKGKNQKMEVNRPPFQ